MEPKPYDRGGVYTTKKIYLIKALDQPYRTIDGWHTPRAGRAGMFEIAGGMSPEINSNKTCLVHQKNTMTDYNIAL